MRGEVASQRGAGALTTIAEVLGILVALLGIWEILARTDVVPGLSPVQRVDRTLSDARDVRPTVVNGGILEATPLAAPTGLTIEGSCESGFVLRWTPVPGATNYRVERDGAFRGSESGTEFQFDELPDDQPHEYRVIAENPPSQESAISAESAVAGPCSL